MNNSIIIAFALIAAIGLVTVVAVDISQQEAEAKGCSGGGTGFNASQGKCFKP